MGERIKKDFIKKFLNRPEVRESPASSPLSTGDPSESEWIEIFSKYRGEIETLLEDKRINEWANRSFDHVGRIREKTIAKLLTKETMSQPSLSFYRQGKSRRQFEQLDILTAIWMISVQEKAEREAKQFNARDIISIRESMDRSTLREIAKLSALENGPRRAFQFLRQLGITVVVVESPPTLPIDGAASLTSQGYPIIALSGRYDRLDNFWFTLLHEVAHVLLHVSVQNTWIADDIEHIDTDMEVEREADRLAKEAFVPRNVWLRSAAYRKPSEKNIHLLADELGISPAIIAGRLRYELNSYEKFSDLIGHGEVRRQLGDW